MEETVAGAETPPWSVEEPGLLWHAAAKLTSINTITRLRTLAFRCIFLPNSNLRFCGTNPAETNDSDLQPLVPQAQRFSLPHSNRSKYTAIFDPSLRRKLNQR